MEEKDSLSWGERFLLAVAILLYFGISPSLLAQFGMIYDTPSGPFISKLHPATYILMSIFCLSFVNGKFVTLALHNGKLVQFFYAFLAILFTEAVQKNEGSIGLYLDTYLAAGVAVGLLSLAGERFRASFFVVLCCFVTINAAIGISEALIGRHLIPLKIGGIDFKWEVRSTALMGHPLTNSLITSTTALLVLWLPGNPVFRFVTGGIMTISLLAFGGRTASGLFALGFLFLSAHHFLSLFAGRRISVTSLMVACIAVLVVLPTLLAIGLSTDIGEQFQQRWQWDSSAETRRTMFQVFDAISWSQLLFGSDPAEFAGLTGSVGLEGIENCWIAMFIRLGVFLFSLYALGLGCLFRTLTKGGNVATNVAFGVFLIGITAAVSISAKTALLLLFCSIMTCAQAYRRRGFAAEARAGREILVPYGRMAAT